MSVQRKTKKTILEWAKSKDKILFADFLFNQEKIPGTEYPLLFLAGIADDGGDGTGTLCRL